MTTGTNTDPTENGTQSRKNRRNARRRTKRRGLKIILWGLSSLAVLGAAAELGVADLHATPKATVSFAPSTNQLQVHLIPGTGILASWVYAHSTLSADILGSPSSSVAAVSTVANAQGTHRSQTSRSTQHTPPAAGHGQPTPTPAKPAHTWSKQVQPSQTVRVQASANGPFLTKPSVSKVLKIPVAPAAHEVHNTATAQTITFNTPIQSVKVVSGSAHIASQTATSVVFQRGVSTYAAKLLVTAKDGEIGAASVKVPALAPVPEYFFGSPAGNHVYITIDDGWVPSQQVLALMKKDHIPLTAFLIDAAAREHLSYWKAFAAAGGDIEDHTDTHPWLTHLAPRAAESQWAKPVADDKAWYGTVPTVGRPPYGDVNTTVRSAARAAGLNALVMWSAEFDPSNPAKGLTTWNGKPLAAGEIILLHWQTGLYGQLEQVLALCKERGLVPAPLLSGLPSGS